MFGNVREWDVVDQREKAGRISVVGSGTRSNVSAQSSNITLGRPRLGPSRRASACAPGVPVASLRLSLALSQGQAVSGIGCHPTKPIDPG